MPSSTTSPPAVVPAYEADDARIDPAVSCSACDAVCCRLTVLVMPEDDVPRHLVERNIDGLEVMARDEEGWCAAIDHHHMRCGIYEQRPGICRRFAMGGAYCRDERKSYRELVARGIPLTVLP
jgi:Fe-S-cluster containining protein